MAALFKKGLFIRNLKNISHQFANDELHGLRELNETMHKLLPPISGQQDSIPNRLTIVMPPVKFKMRLAKFRKVFSMLPNPNDSNGDDRTDAQKQRDEEVQKLQDLRQRNIDHNFHQESVWKAMEERDKILGRKDDKSTKNGKEDEEK